jgi:hypothetical protein
MLTINLTFPPSSILLAYASVSGESTMGLDFKRNGIP